MRTLSSLVSGLLLGLGLVVSGMADPAKVLNFLDLAGTWDPSLAFVMGGAVAVTFVGYSLAVRRGRPLFDVHFHLPTVKRADGRLLSGAAIFGAGWGLAGLCPGPAMTSLTLGETGTLVFVAFMLAGMWAARLIQHKVARPPIPQTR